MSINPVIKDPVVKKAKAIQAAGNASKLARVLGIDRASVCVWGENVPPLQAYRLINIFPHLADE